MVNVGFFETGEGGGESFRGSSLFSACHRPIRCVSALRLLQQIWLSYPL